MTIKTYVGDGAFYDGIPARDLTDADLAALTEAQRELVNASPLYVDAVRPVASPATPADDSPSTPAADGTTGTD